MDESVFADQFDVLIPEVVTADPSTAKKTWKTWVVMRICILNQDAFEDGW